MLLAGLEVKDDAAPADPRLKAFNNFPFYLENERQSSGLRSPLSDARPPSADTRPRVPRTRAHAGEKAVKITSGRAVESVSPRQEVPEGATGVLGCVEVKFSALIPPLLFANPSAAALAACFAVIPPA